MATTAQQQDAVARRRLAAQALGVTYDQYIAGVRDGTYGPPQQYVELGTPETRVLQGRTPEQEAAYQRRLEASRTLAMPYDDYIASLRAGETLTPQADQVNQWREDDRAGNADGGWASYGDVLGIADVIREGHMGYNSGDRMRKLIESGFYSDVTPQAYQRLFGEARPDDFSTGYDGSRAGEYDQPGDGGGVDFGPIWGGTGGGGTGGGGTGGGGTGGGGTGGGNTGGGSTGGGGTGGGSTGGGTGGGGAGGGTGGTGNGGGDTGGGGGYDWNWDYFGQPAPAGVGSTALDLAGPVGEESPWGVEGVPGNNEDFYSQQFARLLTQQNRYRDAAATAAETRANQTQEAPDLSWGWLEGGLPEVNVNEGPSWDWSYDNVQPFQTSNQELLQMAQGDLSPQAYQFHQQRFDANPAIGGGSYYSSWENPDQYMSNVGEQDVVPRSYHQQLANALWSDSNAGNPAPAGYAAPNPQFSSAVSEGGGGDFGYQQGGAQYFFNPTSGGWTS